MKRLSNVSSDALTEGPVSAALAPRRKRSRIGQLVLAAAAALMVFLAFYRAGPKLAQFFAARDAREHAVDLVLRLDEVQAWFAGNPVYTVQVSAVYPPATYVLLWPLVGWGSLDQSRWVFLALFVVAAAYVSVVAVRESRAETLAERAFAAMMPLCAASFWQNLGNGQISLFVVAALLASLLLLTRVEASWWRDLAAAALFLAALAKPQLAAPFFWLVLFVPGSLRTAALIVVVYVVMTLAAALFQPLGLTELVSRWLGMSKDALRAKKAGAQNDPNVQALLARLGLRPYAMFVSLGLLGIHGAWTYARRRADVWDHFAITAVFSRLWAYHLWYDSVVLVIAMIALFRAAKARRTPFEAWTAWALLALMVGNTASLSSLPVLRQVGPTVWIFTLVFFVYRVLRRVDRSDEEAIVAHPSVGA